MNFLKKVKNEAKRRAEKIRELEKNQTWVIRNGKIVERETLIHASNTPKKKKRLKRKKLRAARVGYKEYMGSPAWYRRRNAFFQKYKRQCNACFTFKHINLHHMVYRKKLYGIEPDNHLIALCQRCHKDFHDQNGTHQNMQRATLRFIENRRKGVI